MRQASQLRSQPLSGWCFENFWSRVRFLIRPCKWTEPLTRPYPHPIHHGRSSLHGFLGCVERPRSQWLYSPGSQRGTNYVSSRDLSQKSQKGFMVNVKKSKPDVHQPFEHLGLSFSMTLQRVHPAEYLITKVVAAMSAQDSPQLITPRVPLV
jgi:hypothetical protein